jgi:hypothetical protein
MNPVEKIFEEILKITRVEFEDIIDIVSFVNYKLRLVLKDKSFIDVGVSKRIPGRFSFHYDNFPDEQWENVETYPFHFHNGTQNKVVASPFSS